MDLGFNPVVVMIVGVLVSHRLLKMALATGVEFKKGLNGHKSCREHAVSESKL